MPGYLTHAMTLIETARWLRDARNGLRRRRARRRGALTLLDDRLLYFTERALAYLSEEALTAPEQRLPLTSIENGVGAGLSGFAFVGALGPDISAASHILAQNHEWAARTMHRGGPRRSWVDANSTSFVLALLDHARGSSDVSPAERRRVMSYALGHLSHIAADVLLHPAVIRLLIQLATDPDDPLEEQWLETEIDARVAYGYFQRDDLRSGQSWEAYYLEKGDYAEPLAKLLGLVVEAFKKAHGSDRPQEFLCKLDLPDRCRAPKVDAAFLMDGYRNITDWALDEGYDHGPAPLQITFSVLILIGGLVSGLLVANGVGSFDTISHWLFGTNDADVTSLSNDARTEWNAKGLGAADPWLAMLDGGFSWGGHTARPFQMIMGGHIALRVVTLNQVPDGIFGQGTASSFEQDALKAIWTVTMIVKTVTLIALDEAIPRFTELPGWKWPWFLGDLGLDVTEHYAIDREKPEENLEADRLGHALFWPSKVLGGLFAISNFLVLARKSRVLGDPDPANGVRPREAGIDALDIPMSVIVPTLASIAFVWWPYRIHEHVLKEAVGVRWPDADTKRIDGSLPVAVDGAGKRRFTKTGAGTFPVHLFKDDPAIIKWQGDRFYYPEDETPDRPFAERDRADRVARRAKSTPTIATDYSLPELFDHATAFAGLLGLAGAAYEEAPSDALRKEVKAVFKDWNLEHLLDRQWNELMNKTGPDLGLVPLLETWTRDLTDDKDASDAAIEAKLQALFAVREYAGRIEADFRHNAISIDEPEGRASRLLRPGAVLLPNLDYAEVPDPLPSPLVSRIPLLDATADATITPPETETQLSPMRVRRSAEPGVPAAMRLRLHATDAKRVRVFRRTPDTPDKWVVVLGNKGGGAVATEYPIPAAEPPETEYVIESMAFAGDPTIPGPAAPGPLAPAPFSSSAARTGVPVVESRAASDVWIELLHEEGGAEVRDVRDVALFTIAPFLLLPNTLPAERLYITYNRDLPGDPGNYPTVADIAKALRSDVALSPKVLLPTRPLPNFDEFIPHDPLRAGVAGEAGVMYLIDGDRYHHDPWVQDELEIGYAWAPHEWMHVVLHNPRERGLKNFVRNELAAPKTAVFDGVAVDQSSLEYGGNLEVSPPVMADTAAEPLGAAGPAVAAHGPAPLGKIILGEGRPELFDTGDSDAGDLDRGRVSADLARAFQDHDLPMDTAATVETVRAGHEWFVEHGQRFWIRRSDGRLRVHLSRESAADYRRFLEGQRVQPIVTVDTSWLMVGHVDEFMSIVPATAGKPYRLLMASSKLGIDLFTIADEIHRRGPAAHPLTDVHRGRTWTTGESSIPVAGLLGRMADFNKALQSKRLDWIEGRLRRSLGLSAGDVVRLPVVFEELPTDYVRKLGAIIKVGSSLTQLQTAAYTPDVVNLQVFDKHLLVPKPFGARMKALDVIEVLGRLGLGAIAPGSLAHLVGHSIWVTKDTTAAKLSTDFGVPAAVIKGDPKNAGKFSAPGKVIRDWDEIWIPEDTIDLTEAYVDTALTRLGLQVHFIDDWDWYHRNEGEVHCGTNVKRTPAEAAGGYAGKHWWDGHPA